MKLIVMLDCDEDNFKQILNRVKGLDIYYAKSVNYKNKDELNYIVNTINNFFKGSGSVLLIQYSGTERIAKILGDEIPQMIISLSANEKSHYYVNNLTDTVNKVLNIFYKEK